MATATGDVGMHAPAAGPAHDPSAPILLGGTPCPRCEGAVRDGLGSCPGCGAAIPMDATEWLPWGVAEPGLKMSRRESLLLLPPLGIVVAGFAVLGLALAGLAVGVLSEGAGEALGWLAWLLVGGGFLLLIVGLAGLGILWLLERVGRAVGLIVDEAPDDVGPAAPTGPSWHVVFPGCTHLVQLDYPGHQPEWVWCDGTPIPLEWSGAASPEPFTFDEHEASVRLETQLDPGGVVGAVVAGIAFTALSGATYSPAGTAPDPDRYRWRLIVTPFAPTRRSGPAATAGRVASGPAARRGRRSRRGGRSPVTGWRWRL